MTIIMVNGDFGCLMCMGNYMFSILLISSSCCFDLCNGELGFFNAVAMCGIDGLYRSPRSFGAIIEYYIRLVTEFGKC